jgi:subfamily B ATP-binding cassette protein MsbA
VGRLISSHLKRLLAYAKPYSMRMIVGVVLVAYVAAAEGTIAFMVKAAVDSVLHPEKFITQLPLLTVPWNGKVVYLNKFFPSSIHNVWTIFSITVLFLFASKAVAEYLGMTAIQYAGLSAIRDLRNAFYEKVIRQPMGFFQHNPTGRIISVAMNDIERVRFALSDYLADLFMKSFTFLSFVVVMLILDWKLALATTVLLPVVVLPVNKLGKKIRLSAE